MLITPIFFAFGWFAGRIDMKTVIKQAKQLPKRIFDSIDALIDHKSGVASDTLGDIAEQEPQLTELQISLGKLFRSRGENDLAIKLHTKILNSQYLFSNEDKDKVRLELAHDFHRAGLVDRAENILLKLINRDNLYSHTAQELLLNIYQQDKNWQAAIKMAKQLATSDYSYHTEVAQFHCELAQEALIKSNNEIALQHINNALEINRKCVRANKLLGELYFNQEQYKQAIESWQLIEKQNHLYLPVVVENIFDAYLRLKKTKEALHLIKGYTDLYPHLNLCDIVYPKLLNYESPETTLQYMRSAIKTQPNAKIAARIIEIHLNSTAESLSLSYDTKADVELIKNLLLKYHEALSFYRCGRCNFKAKTFFWQCPACYEWESINPNDIES